LRFELITCSEQETIKAGNMVGARLRGGEVIALSGTLGAGKTSFVKGVGEALRINPNSILSPTIGSH
jgi:tRNA threonylcarbamoyladenosine biosynthesis protein TsaE